MTPARPERREAAHAGHQGVVVPSARRWAPPPRRWPLARSTSRSRPAPSTAKTTRCRTVRSAKFHEVTKQIVLTQPPGRWPFHRPSRARPGRASRPSSRPRFAPRRWRPPSTTTTNRIQDEAQLIDFFRREGLQVTTPDVDAFRKAVQAKYLASEQAKAWAGRLAGPHQRGQVRHAPTTGGARQRHCRGDLRLAVCHLHRAGGGGAFCSIGRWPGRTSWWSFSTSRWCSGLPPPC